MPIDSAKASADYKLLKEKYGLLFSRISAALFEADPIGINFESNTDEYDPETATILPRLNDAGSVTEVETIIHEEFCRWFSLENAGSKEKYRSVARVIWEISSQFNGPHS